MRKNIFSQKPQPLKYLAIYIYISIQNSQQRIKNTVLFPKHLITIQGSVIEGVSIVATFWVKNTSTSVTF